MASLFCLCYTTASQFFRFILFSIKLSHPSLKISPISKSHILLFFCCFFFFYIFSKILYDLRKCTGQKLFKWGTCKLRNGKKQKETKRNGKKKNEKKIRRKVTKRNEKKRKAKKTKTK